MNLRLVEFDRTEFARRRDEVLDVYAEAMQVQPESARARRPILASHLELAGLTAVGACDGDRLVGIGYGYLGAPGQWWHDQVRSALSEPCPLYTSPSPRDS